MALEGLVAGMASEPLDMLLRLGYLSSPAGVRGVAVMPVVFVEE